MSLRTFQLEDILLFFVTFLEASLPIICLMVLLLIVDEKKNLNVIFDYFMSVVVSQPK